AAGRREPPAARDPARPREHGAFAQATRRRSRPTAMTDRVIEDGTSRTLVLGGLEASQVDLAHPTRLAFPYMRRIADVLDVAAPAGRPLRALHLGAGLGALARYLD